MVESDLSLIHPTKNSPKVSLDSRTDFAGSIAKNLQCWFFRAKSSLWPDTEQNLKAIHLSSGSTKQFLDKTPPVPGNVTLQDYWFQLSQVDLVRLNLNVASSEMGQHLELF